MNDALDKLIADVAEQKQEKAALLYLAFLSAARTFYWAVHGAFGCPERSLSEPYKVRYCYLCGRVRFDTPSTAEWFKDFKRRGGRLKIFPPGVKRST